MNKTGRLPTILMLLIMIGMVFGLAIGSIIFAKVFMQVTDKLADVDDFSDDTKGTINTVEAKTIPLLDLFIFILLVGSIMGLVIATLYYKPHPALVVIFIIGILLCIFFAGQLACNHCCNFI